MSQAAGTVPNTPVVDNGRPEDLTGFSGEPGNLQKDLEVLAKKMGIEAPRAEAEPTVEIKQTVELPIETEPEKAEAQADQPAKAETVTQETKVPDKFKNADGTVSEEKLQKSLVNVESALERYRQKEIELQRKINQVNKLQTSVPQAQQAQAQEKTEAQSEPMSDFEKQINEDLAKHQNNPGKVLVKLFEAARQAGKQDALQEVQELRMETELSKRQRELEAIGQHDPFVLTEEGFNTLSKIREEKPWLNSSPRPWEAAYREHLADQAWKQRTNQQVKTQTPKAVTAPPAPVTAVDRSSKTTINLAGMTKDQIREALMGQSPEKQAKVFQSLGFKWPS